MGVRSGSLGTAATSGLLFCAASVMMDMMSGQLRANIFSVDPRPLNPHAHKLWLPKASPPPAPSQSD